MSRSINEILSPQFNRQYYTGEFVPKTIQVLPSGISFKFDIDGKAINYKIGNFAYQT